jgi:mercuric ion binding protein
MKTIISFLFSFALLVLSTTAFAQVKKETFKVAGECGMCQKKIEKAAKKAGASFASWNTESKILTVRYNSSSSNTAKIQKGIAAVGYDTPKYKATDDAYDNLDGCCKYDRAGKEQAACCESASCKESACMKDGKCAPGMSCCKDSGCSEKSCCKKS